MTRAGGLRPPPRGGGVARERDGGGGYGDVKFSPPQSACRLTAPPRGGARRAVLQIVALVLATLFHAPAAQAQESDPLYEAARAYAAFQLDVGALNTANIDDARALDQALERVARHNRAALARGWIAYGAMTAAQSPAFARGVRSRVNAAGRAAVLRRLAVDLNYARNRPPGSAEAIRLILQSAAADGARIEAGAARFLALGESLRDVSWANAPGREAEREARLRRLGLDGVTAPASYEPRLRIAAGGAAPLTDPAAFGGRRFWDALAGAPEATLADAPAYRENAERRETINRMLTLGALHILDAARTRPAAQIQTTITDPKTFDCVEFAQLQFQQCVSVTQFAYEGAFCVARHGLGDMSRCVSGVVR